MKKLDFKIGRLYKVAALNLEHLYFHSVDEKKETVNPKINMFLFIEEHIDKLQKKIYIFYSFSEKRKIMIGDDWCHYHMKEVE